MTTFSSALREFRQGQCTMAHLETQIERDIALGAVEADQLLEQLTEFTTEESLDPDQVETLRRCIQAAETRRVTQLGAASNDPSATHSADFPAGRLRAVSVGDVINGRFILEEEVGRGGMSQVFRATDKRRLEARSRDPVVALKIMTVQGIDPGTAFVAMQREAQKSQQLNHPNILRVNDFDRDGSVVYTTMEFLHGESLQQKIARAAPVSVPLDEAVEMIDAMADAMAYAHENKIIHADFKPSNVFVTGQGVVKVIDFGIARAIQAPDMPDDERTVFDPRAALGALTPAYASPEMLEDLDPDPRDDVYSLGCVAYELITGRHPFSKLRATDARDGGHPLKRPDSLTEPQWQALRHTLEFDRERRTHSVRTFLEEFHRQPRFDVRTLARPALATVGGVTAAVVLWLWMQGGSGSDPGTLLDCSDCPPLRVVTAGTGAIGLPLGTGPGADDPGVFERPARSVVIASDFALGAREVTVGEFRAFAGDTGGPYGGCRSAVSNWQPDAALSWQNPGFPQSDDHPVTCVSWSDATAYARWLSQRTGESYRLPSEAEWEYAARGAGGLSVAAEEADADLCAGDNVADRSAGSIFPALQTSDCSDGHPYTAPTDRHGDATFSDLRGNVFEWTQDCWNASYQGAPRDGAAWESGNCSSRVLRGGSWYTAPKELRVTYRNRFDMDYRSNTFGFRIARDIRDPDEPDS